MEFYNAICNETLWTFQAADFQQNIVKKYEISAFPHTMRLAAAVKKL